MGDGDGPGVLPFSALSWAASGAGASLQDQDRCTATVVASRPGTVTVSLTAEDDVGQEATVEREATFTAFDNCTTVPLLDTLILDVEDDAGNPATYQESFNLACALI